jgi:hypothetical protein
VPSGSCWFSKGVFVSYLSKRSAAGCNPCPYLVISFPICFSMPPKRSKAARGKRPARRAGGFMSDAAALAQAVRRIAPYALTAFKGAASLVNAEVKHADVTTSSTVSTTPVLTFLSGVAQGDTNTSRDGNSIKAVGLHGDVTLIQNASATATRVRTLIFVDTRSQGVVPTAADVVDTNAMSGLANIDTEPNRFVILLDRLDSMVLAAQTRVLTFRYDLTADVKNMHLLYSGSGATIASAKGPVVYMLQYSSEATNTPTYAIDSRLFFLDN